MANRFRSVLCSISFLVLSAIAGCGSGGVGKSGDVVGGPCAGDGDCAGGSVCLVEGDFPGGTCTVRCTSQADCPNGSACVQENGGTCLLACSSNGDCRGEYMCEAKSNLGRSGESLVCIR